MKILLIAGHGGGDSGAIGCGRREDELSRELVTELQRELLQYNCDCRVYNMTLSAFHEIIGLRKSYDFTPYDYVLEVHFNAYKQNTDGKTTGSEIYVTTGQKNTAVEEKILKNICAFGFKNRGVKRKNFALINKVCSQRVKAALLETCFIDDGDDMKIYLNSKTDIIRAVASAIAGEFKLKRKDDGMFSDIGAHWAKTNIEKVAKLGIMNGYADGTFKPEKPITRAELATVVSRILAK